MAEDIKETTEAAAPEKAPKKKRNWKGKRLPIVIAAVVVVTVLGVAGWAWRATPEYCDTLCHSTMGKYYDSFVNDTDSLAYQHRAAANNQCLGCHEATLPQTMHEVQAQLAGDYEQPFEKVTFSNDFCLQSGCHTGAGALRAGSIVAMNRKERGNGDRFRFHAARRLLARHPRRADR